MNGGFVSRSGTSIPGITYYGFRPEADIYDVFSVPPKLVHNMPKTHQMRLRLTSSFIQLITYT